MLIALNIVENELIFTLTATQAHRRPLVVNYGCLGRSEGLV